MGGAAGAAIWCMLTVLYALTRNTVRSVDDIENKLGQQCIAEIPFVKRRRNEQNDLLAVNRHLSLYYEAYRTLRTRLTAAAEETVQKSAEHSLKKSPHHITHDYSLQISKGYSEVRQKCVDLIAKSPSLFCSRHTALPGIKTGNILRSNY